MTAARPANIYIMTTSNPSIKILTPCYGGNITSGYFHSIINLFPFAKKYGIDISIETFPNCSLISLGRDLLLHRALKDKSWTHVLWIDSDLKFDPKCILRLLVDDKDIVGGYYPKKCFPIDLTSAPVAEGEETEDLLETSYVATGFMMIKREVVEAMIEHYKDELTFRYGDADGCVSLFNTMIDENGTYLTEDYAFCHRAKSMGFRVWMDKRFILPHIGRIEYSIEQEQQILENYEKSGRITINK